MNTTTETQLEFDFFAPAQLTFDLKFTGDTDESAKIFFEQVINYYSNDSGDADWWKKCDE